MRILLNLSLLALRQLIDTGCSVAGLSGSGEAAVSLLSSYFTDHSQRLRTTLQDANDRAWKGLEVALAGESVLDRLAGTEDKAFRRQVRAFLDSSPKGVPTDPAFHRRCLRELRAARKAGKLGAGPVDLQVLARQTNEFARFSDPQDLLTAERKMLQEMAQELAGNYPNLARLLELEPQPGRSLLVVGVRYFFRRAVEEDRQLSQGLTFAKLEHLSEAQEKGFAALDAALAQHGERLDAMLGEIQEIVNETYAKVTGIEALLSQHLEASRLDPSSAEHYLIRGKTCIRIGNLEQAIADLALALKLHPGNKEARRALATAYYKYGRSKLASGDIDKAIAALDEAILLKPSSAQLYLFRGKMCSSIGNLAQAIDDLARVIELDPNNDEARLPLAWAYYRSGKSNLEDGEYQYAIEHCTQAIRLDSSPPGPYLCRADAYCAIGELDKALADYTQAIQYEQGVTYTGLLGRGKMYYQQMEYDKAIIDLSQALRICLNWKGLERAVIVDVYVCRGRAYCDKGEYEKAKSDSSKALQLNPGNQEARELKSKVRIARREAGENRKE